MKQDNAPVKAQSYSCRYPSLTRHLSLLGYRRRNDDHENVGLDIDRSINQSLYHYFIVRPNADFTNSPLSLSRVGITGYVE